MEAAEKRMEGGMLDELLVEVDGRRYVGHVWLTPGAELARRPAQYWRFAHRGRVVAEFPATTLDTPASVRERFLGVLARIEALNATRVQAGESLVSPHPTIPALRDPGRQLG
jgi:hypothetical protein